MLEANIRTKNRKLVIMGLMTAVTILLTYTPLGMIPTPIISATIMHVPVIIVAILEGPVMGLLMGLIFGLAALIRAATLPQGALDPLFINPLISVLPRLFIALVAYYSYMPFAKTKEPIGIIVGSVLGSLANTVGCLGMLYLLYAASVLEKTGITAAALFWTVTLSAGIAEMVVSAIISFAVITGLKKLLRSR